MVDNHRPETTNRHVTACDFLKAGRLAEPRLRRALAWRGQQGSH